MIKDCKSELWFFIAKPVRGVTMRSFSISIYPEASILRDDYLKGAQEKITDPMILINVVSRRAKQLKSGYKPLVESLERLSAEDMALREITEGKITYRLAESEGE